MLINSTLIAILCVLVSMISATEAIDCRKYVFAPKCRGVSAKRSSTFDASDAIELKPLAFDVNSVEEEEAAESRQLINDLLKYFTRRHRLFGLQTERRMKLKSPRIYSALKAIEDYESP